LSLELQNKVELLPDLPGVYLFFDVNKTVIYVGKSKSLRKRVFSYFAKTVDRFKTQVLVSKILDFDYIVVDTEEEALLLENNLIKEYQPRYNILLKDDKTYPWIVIKSENFPRVYMTREYIEDGSLYFGPYTSVRMVRTLLELIRKLYKLRTCRFDLSLKNIAEKKIKVCLDYHIGNCKAPCVGAYSFEAYNNDIIEIKKLLKGNLNSLLEVLAVSMRSFSENLEFEKANEVKTKIDLLKNYQNKSTVVSQTITNVDVFTIVEEEDAFFVNFMHLVQGAIVQLSSLEVKKKLDEPISDVLELSILHLREKFRSYSKEIIVNIQPEFSIANCFITVPQRGDKLKLIQLSVKNLKYFILDRKKRKENINPKKHSDRILATLKTDLRMQEMPVHIECFDNSNIQGTNPVAACVVFEDAKPKRSEYRHFNIKTVEGANDFASMKEVVFRRYQRLLNEEKALPQLIVIDGGKGQLSSAYEALRELNLINKIAIIGIAKKLEEIYFPFDSVPLYLDKKSESLKLIQRLRNEAHRFGITFHRNKRSKSFLTSEFDTLKGIGEKSKQKLMETFKDIEGVKKASISELETVLNKKQAQTVFEYFNLKNET